MNSNNRILINIGLVILCLYTFLVGISGLSKSIEGISTPEEISVGDQVHFKELELDIPTLNSKGEPIDSDGDGINDFTTIKVKKPWVEVLQLPDQDGDFKFEYKHKHENVTIKDKQFSKTEGTASEKDIKKVASKWFLNATDSAFICLFIGIFATVVFQSSSTTTSLIVAMAGGGIVSITSAVPMVMGANIGTTITNTLVSVGHIRNGEEFKRAFSAATVHDFFNLLAVLIFFPLEMLFGLFSNLAMRLSQIFITDFSVEFQSPIKSAVKWGATQFKNLVHIVGDSDWILLAASGLLTLFMLFSIVKILKSMVLEKVEAFFGRYIFKTAIRAMAFGVVLTVLVQSSSITTSTIVPLAGAGVLTLRQIFPFTLGANVGTTITALMAAMVLNPTAMVVAFSHLIFNIMGILIIYPIKILREIPIKAATKISELALINRFIPLVYLFIVFILIPLTIILLGG